MLVDLANMSGYLFMLKFKTNFKVSKNF